MHENKTGKDTIVTKSIFASKTMWGGVLMILPTVLSFFGINLTGDEVQTGNNMLLGLIEKGSELIGFALVIIGRIKAVKSVNLFGG